MKYCKKYPDRLSTDKVDKLIDKHKIPQCAGVYLGLKEGDVGVYCFGGGACETEETTANKKK